MADSSGRVLTYGRALTGSLLVSNWVRKNRQSEKMIGLLLPSSVGGALANTGVMIAGKVPVNLNFTAGPESMASAVEQCGIRTILTSKVFLAKAKLETMDGMVYLEDILAQMSGFEKLRALIAARLAAGWMARGRREARPRFTGDSDLFERKLRRSQRRDALAPQHSFEHSGHGAGVLDQ